MRGAISSPRPVQVKTAFFMLLLLATWAYFSLPRAHAAPIDQGQASFEQKCKACHSIGGGKLAGPDLKGVTEKRDKAWLAKFIVSPDKLIAQGDPLAKQLVQEYGMPMPNLGVSQQEAENILAYLEAQSQGTGRQGMPSSGASTSSQPGDPAIGKELFTGSTRFSNGAVACISCHNLKGIGALGGGSLARDLTPAYTSFGKEGLTSILQTTPFPVMREAYADHPLTETEIAHLVAFLEQSAAGTGQTQGAGPLLFILAGLIGFFPVMGLFQFLWRGRLQGVRQSLVRRGSK